MNFKVIVIHHDANLSGFRAAAHNFNNVYFQLGHDKF